ncbi:MAG: UvrD-helicase domain-containing protein [Gemmatimonadetes bacterium]|nr:UvrD-helicase domain-containing protein [Gemmatimonadota bacterium]
MVETHSADAVQSAVAMQSKERLSAACPVPFSPDEVSQWERKGRGLAVFRCPDTFSLPEVESRPGTAILVDPDEGREIPGEPDRLVLKLTSRCTPHLNSVVNRIVLPAYRRYIPLYLFASWKEEDLDTGAVRMPDKEEIEAAILPLLKEQLRYLLAFTCVVFPNTEALYASRKPWLTPLEVMMREGLTRAGLPHRLHVRLGPACVDALVGDPHDVDPPDGDPHDVDPHDGDPHDGDLHDGDPYSGAVAVEIDGRAFDRDDRLRTDTVLIEKLGIREVIRFSGSEVVHDLDACVEKVRSTLTARGSGTGQGHGTGPANEPPIRIPDPKPGLAGEQARCLDPRAGVVLTLAPAGSGKTRVLTRRVVEAVRGGIKPDRILCVVFNKAASEVMSERIHGDAGLHGVHIRTLHSLGFEICRQAPGSPYTGYGVVTEQTLPGGLTDLFRKVLKADFEQHAAALPYPFPEHLVVAYEEAASRYRRTLMPIGGDDSGVEIEGFDGDQARRISEDVDSRMKEKALMTFDEQLFRAVEILLEHPATRSVYLHRFDSVLVDEVQDLTPVQFLMLRLLSLPLNNLFAVGDDDQMINTFTGADPENIRSFQRWYPGAAIHTLGANYRCRPDIVTRSASVISHNVNRFDKPIRPVQTKAGPARDTIRVIACPSLESETDAVVRTIRRWRKGGYGYGDMAVLVRVQSIAAPLQSAFKEADLPFDPMDAGALFQSHAGRTLGAYLDVIACNQRADPRSYALSLSFPSRRLSNEQLREAAALGHRFFERTDRLHRDVSASLEEYRGAIEILRGVYTSPDGSPVAFLEDLLDRTGLGAYYKRQEENSRQRMGASDVESIDSIRQIAARYACKTAFVESYLGTMAAETTENQMDRLYAGASLAESGNDAKSAEMPVDTSSGSDRVTITTIHRSKGDEYKGVILFNVVEDILPHRRMTGSEADIEEERRVFYVALTRAEERLCITTQRKHPSRFLAEMKSAAGGSLLSHIRGRLPGLCCRLMRLRTRLARLRGWLSPRSIRRILRRLLP